MAEPAGPVRHRSAATVPLVVAAVLSAAVLVLLLVSAWRGLDPIDESYVLRLVRFPEASVPAGEVYLFPFLVHPLLALCGNDIGLFRLVGDLLVGAVAAGCFVEAAALVVRRPRRLPLVVGATAAAASAQLVFLLEVRVLSYRSLALLGLLLAAWGVARLHRRRPVGGGVLVGVGACVTFVAKPTSAVALALAVVVLAVWARPPLRALGAAVLGLLAGLAVVLGLAQMTPTEAVRYLVGGFDVVDRIGAYPSIAQVLGLGPVDVASLLLAVPLLVVLGAWLLGRRHADDDVARVDVLVTPVLAVVGLATAWLAVQLLSEATNGYRALGLGVVLLGLALTTLWGWEPDRRRTVLPVLVLLALVPYLYAVGSNRALLTTTGQTSVAWVVLVALHVVRCADRPATAASSSAARRSPSVAAGFLVAATSCVVVMVAALWWDGPLGAQPGRATEPVRVLGGTLDLAPEAATALGPLREVALRGGLDERTPVVDLSGTEPAAALVLGGPPLGRAHLYTAWSGGVESARLALSKVSCQERARAWVIVPASGTPPLAAAWASDWSRAVGKYEVAHRYSGFARSARTELLVLRPGPGVAAALGCG